MPAARSGNSIPISIDASSATQFLHTSYLPQRLMQFINTIALASGLISAVNAIAAPAANPTKCNADNCLRDVRASAFPTRSGIADCQAFQTVTSTVVTTTTVAAAAAPKVKRAVVDPNIRIPQVAKRAAPTIPAYAPGCSNSAQYALTCSCASVTTSTKTVTSTVSSTSTPAAARPTGTYAIQQQGSANGNINYSVLTQDFISNSFLVDLTQTVNLASASKFNFVADSANPTLCRLRSVTTSSAISVVADYNSEFDNSHYLHVSNPAEISAAGYKISPVYCVKGAANKLQCPAVDSMVHLRGI
ncbi:hypothetical protein GQ607_015659 [Colletotrichum asianum]|uniref:Uncharacterized protein n=1 Tax=Colletotrichum asianum TaxID=702518 RepID=A0A8H3W0M7_9PEZI|nr:hypothetical protein GQ607_015659 [Colletotrichum asianum]